MKAFQFFETPHSGMHCHARIGFSFRAAAVLWRSQRLRMTLPCGIAITGALDDHCSSSTMGTLQQLLQQDRATPKNVASRRCISWKADHLQKKNSASNSRRQLSLGQ